MRFVDPSYNKPTDIGRFRAQAASCVAAPRIALPAIAAAAALLLALPARGQLVVPDAFTDNLVVEAPNGDRIIRNDHPGPTTAQVQGGFTLGSFGTARGSAVADTIGFFQPVIGPNDIPSLGRVTAVAQGETLPTDPQFPITVSARMTAQADFVFFIGLTGSASGVASVPIDISATGMHNLSVHAGNGSGSGQALIAVGERVSPSATTPLFSIASTDAGFGNNTGGFFSETRRVMMEPGDVLQVVLRADVAAVAEGDGTAPYTGSSVLQTASIDPSFRIPTDFASRDSFTFVVSPNLAPIPEPSSGVLMLAGAMAIVLFGRKRARFGAGS
jgi:hypothetical protein